MQEQKSEPWHRRGIWTCCVGDKHRSVGNLLMQQCFPKVNRFRYDDCESDFPAGTGDRTGGRTAPVHDRFLMAQSLLLILPNFWQLCSPIEVKIRKKNHNSSFLYRHSILAVIYRYDLAKATARCQKESKHKPNRGSLHFIGKIKTKIYSVRTMQKICSVNELRAAFMFRPSFIPAATCPVIGRRRTLLAQH